MIFRCTRKVQARLHLPPRELDPSPSFPLATDWHCNVLTLARRPYFHFAHTLTLFGFFLPAAGSSARESCGAAFRACAQEILTAEGFSPAQIRKVIDDGPDTFCAATDLRVLASMADFARMTRYSVEQEGRVNLQRIDGQTNEAPMGLLGMDSPRQSLHSLLTPRGSA